MKSLLPALFILLFQSLVFAQNDDCSTAIELAVTPVNSNCPSIIYSNINATDGLGSALSPVGSCFNGLKAFKDVWFKFKTGSIGYQNYRIEINGIEASDGIKMPQMALYIGNCTDGFSEEFCKSQDASIPTRNVRIDAGNMRPNTTYYIQVANFIATDAGGRFTACIRPFDPIYNLTLEPQTSLAFEGTLYDSGGPLSNYQNNENERSTTPNSFDNYTFNIRPNGAGCIELNFENLNTEPNTDTILIVDGNSNGVLDRLSGSTNKQIRFVVPTNWVKVVFRSNESATGPGFKLNWRGSTQCATITKPTSCSAPEIISNLPFSKITTTCSDGLNSVSQTPCSPTAKFIEGKDHIYKYTSQGNECISVRIGSIPTALYSGLSSAVGAGLGIYRGCPNDASSVCISQGKLSPFKDSLIIKNASLDVAGDYYIVVGRKEACMPYAISIANIQCLNVLPNAGFCDRAISLNDCSNAAPSDLVFDLSGGGDTTFLSFSPKSINAGCILTYGTIPPSYAFVFLKFKAQKDGIFAFTVGPIDSDAGSDIDFNMYGPIDSAQQICAFGKNNVPTRSSYGQERFFVLGKRTGLVESYTDIYGNVITPTDTCESFFGDGLLAPLRVQKDKYYLIWLNDYLGTIGKNGVRLSFEGTTPGVLDSLGDPLSGFKVSSDIFLCRGDSIQLTAQGGISYNWSPTTGLSSATVSNPKVSPALNTTYNVAIQGTCRSVNKSVKVNVFNVRTLPDQTVCKGQKLQLIAGENFPTQSNSKWVWSSPSGHLSELSATNVPSIIFNADNTTNQVEKHIFVATLISPTCTFADTFNIFVNPAPVPNYQVITFNKISRDTNVCLKDTFKLLKAGFDANADYVWSSVPSSSLSDGNSKVSPLVSTKYYLTVTGLRGGCTLPVLDSVIVNVFTPPILNLASDTILCRDEKITLGYTALEKQTNYLWSPSIGVENIIDPNSKLVVPPSFTPTTPILYRLTAKNVGGCITKDSIRVIGIDVRMKITPADSLRICRDSKINLSATTSPKANAFVKWRSNKDYELNDSLNLITVSPKRVTKYYATLSQSGCTRTDSVTIYVDSLPFNTQIIPQDTTICKDAIAVLRSPSYENVLFPKIKSQWLGGKGFITSDTLFDMVIQGDSTRTYARLLTNGLCKQTDTVKIYVTPLPKVTLRPTSLAFCPSQNVPVTVFADTTMVTSIKWKNPSGQEIKEAEGKTSFSISPNSTGVYTVEVKNGSCPASASVNVVNLPMPEFGKPKAFVCAGQSVALNTLPNSNYTYSWSGSKGFSSALAAPIVTPTEPSTYTVAVKDGNNCVTNFTLNVTPAIGTLTTSADATICIGNNGILNAVGTSNTTDAKFKWSTGETTPNITIQPAQSGSYAVTYTYAETCTLNKTINVTVVPGITLQIVPDTFTKFVDEGTLLKLTAVVTGTTTPAAFNWNVNAKSLSSGQGLNFTAFEDANVKLTAVTTLGCTDTVQTKIKIRYPNFELPNAFTPNGDTINAAFNLIFDDNKNTGTPQLARPRFWKGNLTVTGFQIFSRNGKILFEENNENVLNNATFKGWDGTSNGTDVAPDVYVYLISLKYPDGTPKTVSGEINLIR